MATPAEADGVEFVDVRDPATGTSFRFYDFEYQLALQLDGKPLADIVAWAASAYGLELTADGIAEFAGRLSELGFLLPSEGDAGAAGAAAAPAAEAAAVPESNEAEWLHSARTAQFTPDAAVREAEVGEAEMREAEMRDGAGGDDAGSVIPEAELDDAPSEPAPAARPPGAKRSPTDPSGVTELPDEDLTEYKSDRIAVPPAKNPAPPSPPAPTRGGYVPPPSAPSRSPTFPGHANGASDSRVTAKAPTTLFDSASVPLAPPKATTPPRGISERRQPPSPDRVVMAPFQEETSRGRFTAPPPARSGRRGPWLILLFVVLGAAGGAAWKYRAMWQRPTEPKVARVHLMAPKPTAVYRWFSTTGAVVDLGTRTLAFEEAGKVAEVLPGGASFEAGETMAKLQNAAVLESELAQHQSRVAFYEQMRDSMKAADNQSELRQAEIKLSAKKKLVEETKTELAKVLLKAPEPGKVLESMVKAGAQVAAKAPVLKWKGTLLHGDFTLDEEDFSKAGALEFCRVEVSGTAPAGGAGPPAGETPRFVDCKLPRTMPVIDSDARTGSPLRKFAVALPADVGLVTGQSLRLARLRYDGVFPLPPSAVVRVGDTDKVWIALASGTASMRAITIAESREEILVSSGLSVGDEVIVDPPTDLQEGAHISIER